MTRLPECTSCYKPKCPRGRDPGAVRGADYCNFECDGYYLPPYPGVDWPGEAEEQESDGAK